MDEPKTNNSADIEAAERAQQFNVRKCVFTFMCLTVYL
jgi:hypothetical protein